MSFFFQLTTEQLEATGTKLCTILCSVLFFFLLSTLTFLLSFRCSVIGRRKDLAKWCFAIPRFVFGVCALIVGFYYVIIDNTLKNDVIHAKTPLSVLALHFMAGYCIYEIIYCSLFKVIGTSVWFHHIIFLFAVSLVVFYEKAHFSIVGAGLLGEIIIPFGIIKWILFKTDSRLSFRKLNQTLVILSYHCRSLNDAYHFYIAYSQWNTVLTDLPLPLLYTFLTVPPITSFILIYLIGHMWFIKVDIESLILSSVF